MKLSPKRLVLQVFAVLLFAILATGGFLAWRLTQGPIDLGLIRPHVERSLSDARGGQPVRIESLALEWSPQRGGVEAAARGVTALDGEGGDVFRADRAVMSFDALALVTGRLKTRRIRLEDGAARVVRSADGVWSLADIVLAREPESGERPFDPLRDLNWTTLATPIRALVSAGSFERVELAGFDVVVDDRKAGTSWRANPVEGLWVAGAEGVTLDLDMKLAGAAEPNRIGLTLSSDGAVSRAQGELELQGVDPMSIARMFGYTGEGFSSGMPANAVFQVAATEADGLRRSRLRLTDVNGRARVLGTDVAVSGLSLDAAYDPATMRLDLTSLSIASDKLSGEFTGWAELAGFMAGAAGSAVPFHLSASDAAIDLAPVFEPEWTFESMELSGRMSPDMRRLRVDKLEAQTGGMRAEAKGDVWLDGEGEVQLLGVTMAATAEGEITPQQVVQFWPANLGSGGRNWVSSNIPQGRATRASFTVDWPPGAASGGFLPDEHLTLEFEVADATVIFLSDFPPVTNVTGKGRMRGNSLEVEVTGGKLESWEVDEGSVVIPRFAPSGAVMEVKVMGQGGLRDLMRVLERSDLKVGTAYGLAVDQMTGNGGIDVVVRRPMLGDSADEQVTFSITGGFMGASAPELVAGFGLTSADARFELNQNALTIRGAGRLGPAPVVFDWTERFGAGSELTASARVTPDLLNSFGLAARNVMQGTAAVELTAQGRGGRDFTSVFADVDLTMSALEIAELGWRKRFDAPARGVFRYGQGDDGALITGDIRADGLELIGEIRLDGAGAFETGFIERIFSRDAVDLRGGVSRRADGGLRFAVSGPYFDVSPWMDNILTVSGEARPPAAAENGRGGPEEPLPALELAINVDRLKLREAAELTNSVVELEVDELGPRSGRVTGRIDGGGGGIEVAIAPAGASRRITIQSDDAGFAARVLTKLDYFRGGKLSLDGTLEDNGAINATITMTDVRMRDAPVIAQIFSLASLRGLADVLSGEGVLFTRVDAPVKLAEGRIELPGLRASGPAMGITARGWVSPSQGDISLDGVLVPSFGVNSLLGGLPIIGDLFVSRQGEGIIAMTYSVRGTLEAARVSVNPLAAFTPGVLRRVFENPGEPLPAN